MNKWIVTLAAATMVDGVLRQPVEGPLTVGDAEAQRLFENKLLKCEPEPVGEPDDEEGDGLEKMTVADLHLLVTKEGVALNDASKKAEIIAAIRKHREANAS